jgi:hypothetical protein
MAEQSSFSTPGALQLADEYLTRRQQGLSARNELDSLLAAVSGEGFRNQQEKDAFTSLQQYIAQNAQDQSEIQAAERLSALLGPATKRQDDTPHYSFPEEQINVYQQSQADPANVAAMQSPQSQTGLSELIAMMSQSDQSPAMASESFDGASITGSQSGQSMESSERLAKMQAAQKALGQSEAPIGDLISSIPVGEGQQQNFVMDEELVRGGGGMTFSGMSKEPDLSGQTPVPLSPPSRGIMSTPEEQRNDLLSQYDMHQEEMRNIPRTLLGQIAPRDQAKFSHHKRESDRALALLEGIDKGAAEKDAAFNMMDAAGVSQEFPRISEASESIDGMSLIDGSKTFDGMTMEADQSNFGKVMAPGTRGPAPSQKKVAGRKSAAVDDPLDYVSPTGDADFAAIDAELGRREAPARQSTRAADNILESMLAEQNQAKEYMQLMPSIDMLRRQISGMGNRDQALGNLESRIKSAKSASDLFSLDADVRNVGGDVARTRDSFVDALGTGSQTAQKMFELEASKPASRKKLATEMFGAMQGPELVSYGDDFREYLGERPEVRVQYSKALSKQAEKLKLAASKDSDNAVEYNKALLEIKKTQAEIKKLEAERKKIQAATKKTLSSAKSKGKGASRAQQTTILKEIYARQGKAPRAKLKAIEERLKNLGRQGIFDPKQDKEIGDLQGEAAVYRDQIREIGKDYLRVEQALAKGKTWSDVVDSISE